MKYKIVVSYDGSQFHGWAKQIGVRTVQETIEQILLKVFNENIHIDGSGRTDAFVHAYGQTFSFKTKNIILKPKKILQILNNSKPSDISFISVKKEWDSFHARFSAKWKVYEYHINLGKENIFYNNYICNYVSNINLKLMKKIAYLFVGTHDFKSFSRSVSDNTIRTIKKITFIKKEQKIIISIMGNGFLRNMVRMIIGNIFDVLENKKTIQQINDLLEHPIKGSAVSKAPACGLYLKKVIY